MQPTSRADAVGLMKNLNARIAAQFTPIVLTHRRPRVAEITVRHLIDSEGVTPEEIILVVNGEGGLEDRKLQSSLDVIQIDRNSGPANGFSVGLEYALRNRTTEWLYLMEDDAGLLDLPVGRANRIIHDLDARLPDSASIGAVVAYGRVFAGDSGRTVPHVPGVEAPPYAPVDVAAWGATLIRRQVVESGTRPDPGLFFGYEDFDFFLRLQHAGWQLVVDTAAELSVGHQVTDTGRTEVFRGQRPNEQDEPWRHYYRARNFLVLQRRWGNWRWLLDHLLRSLRRWQLTGWNRSVALALARGLFDGFRGRIGPSRRYQRKLGEFPRSGREGGVNAR
jgi:GT2 family glycosyltransferase